MTVRATAHHPLSVGLDLHCALCDSVGVEKQVASLRLDVLPILSTRGRCKDRNRVKHIWLKRNMTKQSPLINLQKTLALGLQPLAKALGFLIPAKTEALLFRKRLPEKGSQYNQLVRQVLSMYTTTQKFGHTFSCNYFIF